MRNASVKDAVDQFRKDKNGQVVLVLQGGGALGAYQVGVYQLHEAGVEPDWNFNRRLVDAGQRDLGIF